MAKLLVVDDEHDIRDLVVKRLMSHGHDVLSAGDGATALAMVQCQGLPDAAVLDIDMPGMDGFDLLTRLRVSHPGFGALFLTVLWSADVHLRIKAASGIFVAKPFTAASLIAGVRQLLNPLDDVDRTLEDNP